MGFIVFLRRPLVLPRFLLPVAFAFPLPFVPPAAFPPLLLLLLLLLLPPSASPITECETSFGSEQFSFLNILTAFLKG
jgi:hypothetical protein